MSIDQARKIPREVAICPICGKPIYIEQIIEVEICESGELIPTHVEINCVDEPDIDSDEWRAWHNWHFSHPYVDWLLVKDAVEKWLKPQQERIRAIWGD